MNRKALSLKNVIYSVESSMKYIKQSHGQHFYKLLLLVDLLVKFSIYRYITYQNQ